MDLVVQDELKKSESITIDLDKVERLVNKVADLVITNSMMSQNIENLENNEEKKRMHEMTTLFERHITELQDYAMELRMINIGVLYEPMQKIIEEATQEGDKKVELRTLGEDTKIDKNMIALLEKPLQSILLNAIKDGIESPKERVLAEKRQSGVLSVKAEQINGQIIITLADDGRGIDIDAVVKNAIEREIVTKEEVKGMGDNEKASLILHGNSMSEVKKSLELLNGTISVATEKGVGTEVSVFIPLTLAILDGLNIRIGSEYFILPTASIIESLQPTADLIKTVGDGSSELLMLREDFIPIVKLSEYLNIKSDYEKLVDGMLIVAKAGNEKVALFIDEFLHQQQVVVKPVDKNFKNIPGISGATVRGDSSIGLILDVQSIIDDQDPHTKA